VLYDLIMLDLDYFFARTGSNSLYLFLKIEFFIVIGYLVAAVLLA